MSQRELCKGSIEIRAAGINPVSENGWRIYSIGMHTIAVKPFRHSGGGSLLIDQLPPSPDAEPSSLAPDGRPWDALRVGPNQSLTYNFGDSSRFTAHGGYTDKKD